MITFNQIESNSISQKYVINNKSIVLVKISVTNNYLASIGLEPYIVSKIDKSVQDIEITWNVDSTYTFVGPNEKMDFSIAFKFNCSTQYFNFISFTLFLCNLDNCSINIDFNIDYTQKDICSNLYIKYLKLDIPVRRSELDIAIEKRLPESKFSSILTSLMQGIKELEKNPSSILFREILLALCESGYEFSLKSDSKILINKIKLSIFYKNGVILTSSSQLINWITTGYEILKGQTKFSSISNSKINVISTWENWIIDILQLELEIEDGRNLQLESVKPSNFCTIVDLIKDKPDQFFLFFVLGLIECSPRMRTLILKICDGIDYQEDADLYILKQMSAYVTSETGSLQR